MNDENRACCKNQSFDFPFDVIFGWNIGLFFVSGTEEYPD
jgi:hypothetical protein